MSNIETCDLPPKIGLSASSALIMRRFFASWSPFRLMYCHSFFVTSVRGIGEEPTTAESCALGCMAFMKAAFGVRFAAFFAGAFFFAAAFLAGAFLADFFAADFFAPAFFLAVAIVVSWRVIEARSLEGTRVRRRSKYKPLCRAQ